ncbi:hypothetical protein PI126_g12797 [Phytophthora idaei]|nr:hypothetical protein PI126_g12797 [Phytophthora idaei]
MVLRTKLRALSISLAGILAGYNNAADYLSSSSTCLGGGRQRFQQCPFQ